MMADFGKFRPGVADLYKNDIQTKSPKFKILLQKLGMPKAMKIGKCMQKNLAKKKGQVDLPM